MSEIITAIDVSSHQPRDLTTIIRQLGPRHIIPKLYMPWESVPWDHTAAQAGSGRASGCTVGGYVWAYRSVTPEATIRAVVTRCASIGLVLPILWLDCETYAPHGTIEDPGPDADWIRRALATATAHEMPVGIYTGRWWVREHFPGGEDAFAEFNGLPLWLADYRFGPHIEVPPRFSGFERWAGLQWTDTPVDQNVIRSEHTVYQDPCAVLRADLKAIVDRRPFRVRKRELEELLAR